MTVMEIKTYEIETNKRKKEERPLRIAMLADLHDRLWGEGQRELLDAIDRLSADLVLSAGDMLLGRRKAEMENSLMLFDGIKKRGLTVVAANGNHESRMRQLTDDYGDQYEEYAGRLRALGVKILENESCEMEFGFMKTDIYGYEMPLEYYHKFCRIPFDREDLYRKLGKPKKEAFNILLPHNPVYFKAYAGWGADLTLAGHLHGGIIRIPGIGGVITPQAKLFPRYDRGLFENNGKYMAVSAGLGEHTVPIRIFNPPQLVCIVIKGTGR